MDRGPQKALNNRSQPKETQVCQVIIYLACCLKKPRRLTPWGFNFTRSLFAPVLPLL
jgi:hypothetical protein